MIIFKDDITKGKDQDIYERIMAFLQSHEPALALLYARLWTDQQNALTYQEIREAIEAGEIGLDTVEAWRQDYSHFIREKLMPQWREAMEAGSKQTAEHLHNESYNPYGNSVQDWMEKHSAERVVDITENQRTAINGLVQRAVTLQNETPDSLAVVIRPTIGLYPQQAQANLRYYQTVKQTLQDAGSSAERATRQAQHKALIYAGKQHRYRAQMIARTELMFAYNAGEIGSVRQAISDGMMMPTTMKRWSTAKDARVCPECQELSGITIPVDRLFPGDYDAPPAHPHCRCVLVYVEQ
ncbi:MAG: phage minor head protein [Eubacteriaceae bacterium]|nr:phage minor head protein [Eubacteriaceae bacterium]